MRLDDRATPFSFSGAKQILHLAAKERKPRTEQPRRGGISTYHSDLPAPGSTRDVRPKKPAVRHATPIGQPQGSVQFSKHLCPDQIDGATAGDGCKGSQRAHHSASSWPAGSGRRSCLHGGRRRSGQAQDEERKRTTTQGGGTGRRRRRRRRRRRPAGASPWSRETEGSGRLALPLVALLQLCLC